MPLARLQSRAAPPAPAHAVAGKRVLIVSRHDYRTKRRASIHFIARAMADQGHDVHFVSIGFSWLSRMRGDGRAFLDDRANRWEMVDGVRAFLWKGAWHAADIGWGPLRARMGWLYDLWARGKCEPLDAAAANADVILVESGTAPLLIERLHALAPAARIVYRAADLLHTVGVHPHVQRRLDGAAARLDLVVLVSPAMLPHFDAYRCPKLVLPHGVDRDRLEAATSNPYEGPRNIVTVGAMLFDEEVIRIAARALPDHRFHLIGVPEGPSGGNVVRYPEMPFEQTLPYLQHADIGLAAYRAEAATEYLADSSLKLLQYEAIGLPAVCPHFAVGDRALRFGYQPGSAESIVTAFRRAAAAPRRPSETPDWSDVARRLMEAASD
jgi:2-beta-glucuronyltransferase